MNGFITYLKQKTGKVKPYYREHGLIMTVKGMARELMGYFMINERTRWLAVSLHKLRALYYYRIPIPIARVYLKVASFACAHAYHLRDWINPRKVTEPGPLRVIHVTCSFDLGGTQRQIINLCENNPNQSYQHEALEIFPEQNYLYRTDVQLEADRYLSGNWLNRFLGRRVLDYSSRSVQLYQIYKLVRDFRARKPDLVVGWGHEMAMLTFIAAAIAGVPSILFCIRTFNPAFGWTEIGPLVYKSHRCMFPHLDGLLVNSTPLKKDYAEWLGIEEEQIRVCANGIDFKPCSQEEQAASRGSVRQQFGIPEDDLVIMNIGRFSKEKGQMLLTRALHQLKDRDFFERTHLLLCGDGPTLPDVRAFAEAKGMNRVHLAGRIEDVHRFLSAADLFVMPSNFEGMPNAMMEAMAYGLPCISTNKSGIVDIARQDREALYIEVGAEGALAERLAYLLENPEERARLGQAARERLQDFSIAKMVRTFNGHLDQIVKQAKNLS